MIYEQWEWFYTCVACIHTTNDTLTELVRIDALNRPDRFDATKYSLQWDWKKQLHTQQLWLLSRDDFETLKALTQATGIFDRPLELQNHVDSSDVTSHEYLIVQHNHKKWLWVGQCQVTGYEGPGADEMDALLRFLKVDKTSEGRVV